MRAETKETTRKCFSTGFPELSDLNIVESPEREPIFQLFLSECLEGSAVWIDVGNKSSTYALASIGSKSLMDSVKIGRAFTAFQHHSLVMEIEEYIEPDTEILVLPSIDRLYLEGQLSRSSSEQLFTEVVEKIRDLKEEYKIVTSIDNPSFSWMIEGDAKKIEVERTGHGLRVGDRQLFYRKKGSIQTTVNYWYRYDRGDAEWEEQTRRIATI